MKKKLEEFSGDIFILLLYDLLLLGIQTAYAYICSINQTLYILSNTSSKISQGQLSLNKYNQYINIQ